MLELIQDGFCDTAPPAAVFVPAPPARGGLQVGRRGPVAVASSADFLRPRGCDGDALRGIGIGIGGGDLALAVHSHSAGVSLPTADDADRLVRGVGHGGRGAVRGPEPAPHAAGGLQAGSRVGLLHQVPAAEISAPGGFRRADVGGGAGHEIYAAVSEQGSGGSADVFVSAGPPEVRSVQAAVRGLQHRVRSAQLAQDLHLEERQGGAHTHDPSRVPEQAEDAAAAAAGEASAAALEAAGSDICLRDGGGSASSSTSNGSMQC